MAKMRLRAIREKKGISVNELARRSGVSNAIISMMERDKHTNPSVDLLCKIADALEVNMDDIVICDPENQ